MVYIRQRHDSNVYFRRTAPLGTFGIHYFSAARRMDTSTKVRNECIPYVALPELRPYGIELEGTAESEI